jgi:hypothetical protein
MKPELGVRISTRVLLAQGVQGGDGYRWHTEDNSVNPTIRPVTPRACTRVALV